MRKPKHKNPNQHNNGVEEIFATLRRCKEHNTRLIYVSSDWADSADTVWSAYADHNPLPSDMLISMAAVLRHFYALAHRPGNYELIDLVRLRTKLKLSELERAILRGLSLPRENWQQYSIIRFLRSNPQEPVSNLFGIQLMVSAACITSKYCATLDELYKETRSMIAQIPAGYAMN